MPRGRPKGSRNKPKLATKTKPVAAPAVPRPIAEPNISAAALKRSMIESTALLEENKDRARTANEIKRSAIERGVNPRAYNLGLSLWRLSRTDLHALGSFLRGFDKIRDALAFDAMIPADFFEATVEGRKSHLRAIESEEDEADAPEMPTSINTPIEESYEQHPAA